MILEEHKVNQLVVCGVLLLIFSMKLNAGWIEGQKAYKKGDYATALLEYKESADKGDVASQYSLAEMYEGGEGVKQSYTDAFVWYLKAANQGHAQSQTIVGNAYKVGAGVEKNLTESVRWYLKAAKQGYVSAQYSLGNMFHNGLGVNRDDKEAVHWYTKAANQNHIGSQFLLAQWYQEGYGVKQDDKQALDWYLKVSEHVNLPYRSIRAMNSKVYILDAQYSLGWIYENGRGVQKNYKEAVDWYTKAAEQGYDVAQYNLALMYANGFGVPKDVKQAVVWYKKAAEQGNVKAQNYLTRISHSLSCQKTATTKLFDVAIKCAGRNELRAATKQAGGIVERESDDYFRDTYKSSKLLKNSDGLFIEYTDESEDKFAMAQYTFNSSLNTSQVVKIKDMVASKYGQPSSLSGNVSVGRVTYKWYMKDGIELKVHRGWPDTTTYLTYTYPKHKKMVEDEKERLRLLRLENEAKSQHGNF